MSILGKITEGMGWDLDNLDVVPIQSHNKKDVIDYLIASGESTASYVDRVLKPSEGKYIRLPGHNEALIEAIDLARNAVVQGNFQVIPDGTGADVVCLGCDVPFGRCGVQDYKVIPKRPPNFRVEFLEPWMQEIWRTSEARAKQEAEGFSRRQIGVLNPYVHSWVPGLTEEGIFQQVFQDEITKVLMPGHRRLLRQEGLIDFW